MEPSQSNINILSLSFSSSSSGNLPNMSKNSEKRPKKSILRKEGSQSKNKDKHATFAEPLNQVAFYIPDMYNQNKNHRISLNTVSEEAEASNSGSDLTNNLPSNRGSLNSEFRPSFLENNSIQKNDKFIYNESKRINIINTENNQYFNNKINNINNFKNTNNNNDIIQPNNFQLDFNSNFQNYKNLNNISTNNYINQKNKNNNQIDEIKNIALKNKNFKKPPSRKTLDSEYLLDNLKQNDIDKNNNAINEEHENKSKISGRPNSKFVKIRLSNSGKNDFSNNNNPTNNNINNINNNSNNINSNNNNKQINNNNNNLNNNINTSNNSINEKIEEETKRNTEVNKNLFNINNHINHLNIGSSLIPSINNNNIIQTNIVDSKIPNTFDYKLNNNITLNENQIISKNNKKPNFKKRITIIEKEDTFLSDDFNKNNFNVDNNYNNTNFNISNTFNNLNSNVNNNIQFNNLNNNNITNNLNNTNENKNIKKNIEKKAPKMNKKRITMGISSFEEENFFSDDINIEKYQEPENLNNIINFEQPNSLYSYNDYKPIVIEEPVYVEPIIKAEERNINYADYEKYLKFNNDIIYPLSERKADISFDKEEIINKNNEISHTKRKTLNDTLLHSLENFNKYNNNRNKFNLDSSPLIELIQDKPIRKIENKMDFSEKSNYSISLNNENFDFEKEINNQINFIKTNLEEKEKNWKEIIIQNAERHQDFEAEMKQNQKESNIIDNKIKKINNQINESLEYKNKYDKLSESAQKINDELISRGIDIKDIEHITYKEMNCLLYHVMIKNAISYKFLISDNIYYEKNLSGDTEVTFLGVISSYIFESFFDDTSIINTDKNLNLLIQKYYNEIIKKIFPNEYERISINRISHNYFLSTQISLCYIHILKMITYIATIGEDMSIHTQDLKKYFVKFYFITIFGAKLNFEYILNIENPFSGNWLNAIDIEKNDYILEDFDEYRKKKINIIWKYFNPKDVQISEKYFYNMHSMLIYIDESDAYKKEINDEYIFNVMQGNIIPNEEDDLENENNNNFNSLDLLKQAEIIYGKEFLNNLKKENHIDNKDKENPFINNNIREIESEEIVLDLPSSKDNEENDRDSKENIGEI